LELQLEEEEIAAAKAEPPSSPDEPAEPKGKPKRKPLPADLPRNEEVLSPGDACDKCGGRLKTLGGDVTEELEYVPGVRHRTRPMAHRREPYRPSPNGLRLL